MAVSLILLIICLLFFYTVIKNGQIPKETIRLYPQVSLLIVPTDYSVKKLFNYTVTHPLYFNVTSDI